MDDLTKRLFDLADKLKEMGMEEEGKDVAVASGIVMMQLAKKPEPKYQKCEEVYPGHLLCFTPY